MASDSPIKERKHKKDKKEKKDKKRKRDASPSAAAPKKARTTTENAAPSAAAHPNSPYRIVTTSLYLPLAPKYSYPPDKTYAPLLASTTSEQSAHLRSLSPRMGITRHYLDPLLMRYLDSVDGVVLAYSNIRFETPTARISAEAPFAYVWTTVDLLVWRPRKGMVLEGHVNLQSASHVGCLVDNTWNVSVPRERMPDGWRWEEGEGEGSWVKETGEKVEGKVGFVVESVKAGQNIFLLEGSMVDREKIEAAREVGKNVDLEVR